MYTKNNYFAEKELLRNNCVGVCTYGAVAMPERHNTC